MSRIVISLAREIPATLSPVYHVDVRLSRYQPSPISGMVHDPSIYHDRSYIPFPNVTRPSNSRCDGTRSEQSRFAEYLNATFSVFLCVRVYAYAIAICCQSDVSPLDRDRMLYSWDVFHVATEWWFICVREFAGEIVQGRNEIFLNSAASPFCNETRAYVYVRRVRCAKVTVDSPLAVDCVVTAWIKMIEIFNHSQLSLCACNSRSNNCPSI